MIGIALGMSQETLILICLMLSALSLLLGFLALRRLFGPLVALAAVGFFATSYGVYFAQAGDLLRGLHAVMLWLLVYLMALEWDAPSATRARPQYRACRAVRFHSVLGLGVLPLLPRLLCNVEHICAGRVDMRHLFSWVVLPSALTFLAYFSVIIAHTGLEFFMTDLLVTYFGRMGNVLAGPLMGQTSEPGEIPRALWGQPHRHVGRQSNAGPPARCRHRLLAGDARGRFMDCALAVRHVHRLLRRDVAARVAAPRGANSGAGHAWGRSALGFSL